MGRRPDTKRQALRDRLVPIVLAIAAGLPFQPAAYAESDAILKAKELNRRAVDLSKAGQYDEAIPLAELALRISEKALGPDHPHVATVLDNLAGFHYSKGNHAAAGPLMLRALRIREKAFGPDHPEVALSLNNLGVLYEAEADYARAELFYVRALRIDEKALGFSHPDLSTDLNNLAGLYEKKGDYARAEQLFLRSLRIREKALGPNHPDVARSLNNLAVLYDMKGDYAAAEQLHLRAVRIFEKALGPDHPDVAASLNNLAKLYETKGDYAAAEQLFLRSLRIREKTFGPDHPGVAESLNNLAGLYEKKGDYARAEQLFLRSLRIREKTFGPDHPDVALGLHNLAVLYLETKDYAHAEQLFLHALRTFEKALGPDHPHVARTLDNLAVLYEAKGDHTSAIDCRERGNKVQERMLAATLATGAEAQKQAYFTTLSDETYRTVSLHVRSAPALPEAARLSLITILRRKGRVLEAMRDLFRVVRQHADPGDLAHIDELAAVRAEVAMRTLRGPGQGEDPQAHQRALAELRTKGHQLEEALAARYAVLGVKQVPVTLDGVQTALPLDAALVEYFVFRPFDPKAKSDSHWGKSRYVAYVLRRQGEPGWADLGDAESIDKLAREVRAEHVAGDRTVAGHARELDKLVMQPVRELLGDTTNVFLSPDGELNMVPFGALTDEKGRYLIKRYHFTYLSSGRDLLRLDLRADAREAPTIVADPNYGDAGVEPAPSDDERGLRSVDMGSIQFPPLPGTLVEANRLARTLPNSRLLTGASATEAALKAMHGPRLLHIATHGFFLRDLPAPDLNISERGISHIAPLNRPTAPGGKASIPSIGPLMPKISGGAENPLLRSGLALAGANRRASGKDDGILTAMEAMGLDLIGTQLVVLSACETGMGDASTGDGVYGLRRALVVAGAETQIMSLWRIDDAATANLMAEYYERIGNGEGRSEAMRAVVLKMLANPKTANPKYWASFIVSGDPRPLRGRTEQ